MRFGLLSLLATLAPSFVFADVQFTSPAAGASIAAGTITVTWTDSGDAPSISLLSSYTLSLMVGGNTETNSLALTTIGTSPGSFARGNTATGTISPGLASSLKNGFYLKMISTAKEGGTIINYSSRFTLTGMTGSTSAAYTQAVTALGGSTAGPATENDIAAAAPAAAAPAADTPGANAAVYDIPYAQQTGLTKYCPMQGIPPTKITAKNVTPMYPTSAWTVATTWLPEATIETTLTAPMTFSVQSRINTEPPVPGPSADMQKFLARWKD